LKTIMAATDSGELGRAQAPPGPEIGWLWRFSRGLVKSAPPTPVYITKYFCVLFCFTIFYRFYIRYYKLEVVIS
jgi:hypothetical protein